MKRRLLLCILDEIRFHQISDCVADQVGANAHGQQLKLLDVPDATVEEFSNTSEKIDQEAVHGLPKPTTSNSTIRIAKTDLIHLRKLDQSSKFLRLPPPEQIDSVIKGADQFLMEIAEFRVSATVEQERVDAQGQVLSQVWDDKIDLHLTQRQAEFVVK